MFVMFGEVSGEGGSVGMGMGWIGGCGVLA